MQQRVGSTTSSGVRSRVCSSEGVQLALVPAAECLAKIVLARGHDLPHFLSDAMCG
jgi:hypothetical protein